MMTTNQIADSTTRITICRYRYKPYTSCPPRRSTFFRKNPALSAARGDENLTYYTGIGYLAGASVDAAKGLGSGVKSIESTDTLKLKINRVLNGSSQAGRQLGNRCGIIGLLYAGLESGMVAARDTDDVINSVVAGLGTGAIYKADYPCRHFL
ncbi:Mitochondrial import inner membrane translocase subunit TIM23-1 [Abeliophyllum distichum]|uniref:Mitochondrial import inner membrane translocase subunit TIM23-1 n=1 Tax=Abeliophyllum distichum TaxID=126358 RepID=A0ABD1SVT5_9LAMI